MDFKDFTVVIGAILGTTVRVVNNSRRWLSECDGPIQGFNRQVSFKPVADSPADDAAREQINNDGPDAASPLPSTDN